MLWEAWCLCFEAGRESEKSWFPREWSVSALYVRSHSRSRQTDYMGAVTNGSGRIGAGFREIPEDSYDLAVSLSEKLDGIGLGAFMKIGRPSRYVYNIPVSEGSCGVVVIGGLNPMAILEETGAKVQHTALSGLMEYNKLFSYKELRDRL
ncbi:MAG: NrpR regulatory domain-containing protein [Spirochaetaceae bacterium]|nr:NrpR regulatory domain-containing protein [Spirochaetaceae bacterium]MDT8298778.1 NrpR regulatory domain-containing protein [Spirochaetaceae bacterium]